MKNKLGKICEVKKYSPDLMVTTEREKNTYIIITVTKNIRINYLKIVFKCQMLQIKKFTTFDFWYHHKKNLFSVVKVKCFLTSTALKLTDLLSSSDNLLARVLKFFLLPRAP